MLPSVEEQVTHDFYNWEQRGRGWYAHEIAVEIEPPFEPFIYHEPEPQAYRDDGLRPNIFKRIYNFLLPQQEEPTNEFLVDMIVPGLFNCNEPLVIYSINLPKGQKVTVLETEQLLFMLSYCQYQVSFEILASSKEISLQIACRKPDAEHIASQVKAFFPNAQIHEKEDGLNEVLSTDGYVSFVSFALQQEFMRPLTMTDKLDIDPYIGLFASLENLKDDEHAAIQVLFKGAQKPWVDSIIRSVSNSDGSAFFSNAPDMQPLAKEKVAHPLYAVVIKAMSCTTKRQGAEDIMDDVTNSLVRIYKSPGNSLITLSNPSYKGQDHVDDLLLRQSNRIGMLLNSRELLTLVHFPSPSVTSSKLHGTQRKTKQAPGIAQGHELILGINEHSGIATEVSVSNTQRLTHTHIIGATGTGKSTLVESMIVQDIQNGNGVCLIDPHGDLVDSVITHIPEIRINDVVLIDPSDLDYAVGFNILSANSDIEKEILSSDLVASFKRLSTSWGDQMTSVLSNAILAFLESTQGGTLADLRRFLIEKPFRDTFLKTVTDSNVIYYWQKEYPLLKSSSIGSILTRLDTFLRPKPVRYMVAQKSTLDFENILDSKKILLVKLSQGLIGNENSYLLGTFFVTKLYQAAMARQVQSKESRSDYFVYIDEFQNFITPSMSQILSGARKYHLGLILAHQDMQQLVKYDAELASSITSNAGTRVCFRLGDTDAKRFASGFSYFEPSDLENLNTGQAIVRIERPDFDFSISTIPLDEPSKETAQQKTKAVIDYTRARYGTAKGDIEKELSAGLGDLKTAEPLADEPATPKSVSSPVPEEPKTEPKEISDEYIEATKAKLVEKKEETEHRYLQNYIKKMAESRGYAARLEEPTLDGQGRVDVHLERNGKRIACEVCVTTDVAWEVHNMQKCLNAGYDLVVDCSNDKKTITNIQKAVSKGFSKAEQQKIQISSPEDFFAYLDEELIKEASTETRIKGYRVKVEYNQVSDEEMRHKKSTVSGAVLKTTKKKDKP